MTVADYITVRKLLLKDIEQYRQFLTTLRVDATGRLQVSDGLSRVLNRLRELEEIDYNNEFDDSYDQNTGVYNKLGKE